MSEAEVQERVARPWTWIWLGVRDEWGIQAWREHRGADDCAKVEGQPVGLVACRTYLFVEDCGQDEVNGEYGTRGSTWSFDESDVSLLWGSYREA